MNQSMNKENKIFAPVRVNFEEGCIQWSSSNTSCSSIMESDDKNTMKYTLIKSAIETDETKEGEECIKPNARKREKLTIFVWDKINQKTVSLKVAENFKLKSILKYMIKRTSSKYTYFLIKNESKEILSPERSFGHYGIKNKSMLILTRKEKQKKNQHLIIICNFGAPYNKKLLSSYHSDVNLNEYAMKIKDKFAMPQNTKITFNFRKEPLLGFLRECGIAKLGIKENDTIIAQTNGISFTLSVFGSSNNTALIEMYKYFDLKQLRKQIVSELGISIVNQKALICRGRIVDNDDKCAEIKEYETITVLTQCQCHLKENKNEIKNENENKMEHKIENNNDSNYLYYLHRSHYKFHGAYGRSSHYKQHTGDGRVCKIYRKKVPNQYQNHDDNCEDGDESSGFSDGDDDDCYVLNQSDTLKLCRYGDHCRYFNNPHIFGPCRYYHPPPPISHQNCSWKSYYTLHHGTTKKNKYKTNYTMIY